MNHPQNNIKSHFACEYILYELLSLNLLSELKPVIDNTSYYLMWSITQLFVLAGAALFFGLDRTQVKRAREQGHRTNWYHRGFFVASWIFLVPLLGIQLPEFIVTFFVFHCSVLPSSPDFSYQLFRHSLLFITWLFIISYGLTILLIIYAIYLGIRTALHQQK